MDNKITIKQIFFTLCFCVAMVSLMAQEHRPVGLNNSAFPILSPEQLPNISFISVNKADLDNNWQDRVSIPTQVNYTFKNTGKWHSLDNGDRIWRMDVKCDNAYGLAFMLRNVIIPKGAYLDIYAKTGRHIISRITKEDVNMNGDILAGPVAGREIILEYYEPANAAGQGKMELFNVQRMYKDYFPESVSISPNRDFGDAWACNVNIECFDGDNFVDAERSVARIIMSTEEGMVYCSGTLINNTSQDMTPYILTAFHCVSELTPMYNFYRFDFNFASPFCNTPGQAPNFNSLTGCAKIAGYADSDFELLRIFGSIPSSFNAYFAGWDRTQNYRPDTTTLIHHPVGDVKKISQEHSRVVIFNSTIEWDNDLVTSPRSHYRGFLDLGAYQGGSSGSPLFDNNGHLIGQLHGGDAACDNAKAYSGRLSLSWTGGGSVASRLSEWLDPINSGNLIQTGFDPANSGVTSASVSGRVINVSGDPMVNTTVFLNSNGNYPQIQGSILDSTVTDANGNYTFPDLAMGNDYFVSAFNDGCPRDGIRVSDATKIIAHVLFVNRFSDPYEYIAADINGDEVVTVTDILFIRFLLLGVIQDFPNQDSYIITRSDMVFAEENPLATPWERNAFIFEVSNLSGPALVPDFIAYKSGDTTFDANGCDE